MTEAPSNDVFDANEASERFEYDEDAAVPEAAGSGRTEASTVAERLRALEAFSAA